MRATASRGKVIASSAAVAGVACLAVFVYAVGWDIALEKYYLSRLDSQDESVRLEAVRGLGWIDRPDGVRRLIELANESDGKIQLTAIEGLGRTRHHRAEVGGLLAFLLARRITFLPDWRQEGVTFESTAVLVQAANDFGPEIVPAILRDRRTEGSMEALIIVPALKASVALPGLIEVARTPGDEHLRLKLMAIQIIEALGKPADGALLALISILGDGSVGSAVRCAAAKALAQVAPEDDRTVAALSKSGLGDRDTFVRLAAAWSLASIGRHAHAATAKLIERAIDRSEWIYSRIFAVRTLSSSGSCEGRLIDALAGLVKSSGEDERIRLEALQAWKQLAPGCNQAIQGLVQCLADPDSLVCQGAAEALIACGPGAIAALDEAIAHGAPPLAQAARRARERLPVTRSDGAAGQPAGGPRE